MFFAVAVDFYSNNGVAAAAFVPMFRLLRLFFNATRENGTTTTTTTTSPTTGRAFGTWRRSLVGRGYGGGGGGGSSGRKGRRRRRRIFIGSVWPRVRFPFLGH